jgi:hypothetical protein
MSFLWRIWVDTFKMSRLIAVSKWRFTTIVKRIYRLERWVESKTILKDCFSKTKTEREEIVNRIKKICRYY